jgi:cytochrome P450
MPGKSYLWWFGWEPRITITNLDLIKQVLSNKDHAFANSQLQLKFLTPIIAKGLVTTDGEEWVLHRQIVSPAFHHETQGINKQNISNGFDESFEKRFQIYHELPKH